MRLTRKRQRAIGSTLGALGTGLVGAAIAVALAAPAQATHVEPETVPDNPTCSDFFEGSTELKIEPVESGTYTEGDFSVTIDVDGAVFDFEAEGGLVVGVVVKGGPNANVYDYGAGTTADTGLHAPVNPNNGRFYGLSHISFCFVEETTPPTTEPPTTEPPTTEPPTTEPPTTEPPTTEPPTTEPPTTEPPTTEPPTTEPPTTEPPTTEPPASSPPASVPTAVDAGRTGGGSGSGSSGLVAGMLVGGLVVTVAGIALVASRRSEHEA